MKKNKTHLIQKNFKFCFQKSRSVFYLLIILFSLTSLSGQRPFVTTWNTNINNDNSKQIQFFAKGTCSYSYVNLNDPSITGSSYFTGEYDGSVTTTIVFPQKGIYKLSIVPISPSFAFKLGTANGSSSKKLTEVSQWGDAKWFSMSQAFYNCSNLKITATDIPNLQSITDMDYMFYGCSGLSTIYGINDWNVSNVQWMTSLFHYSNFNQPIGNWNTSKVTDMSSMFNYNSVFNQPIGTWNTSNVKYMGRMFSFATSFNQPIDTWNTSNVIYMNHLFNYASNFNQSLGNWNTSNVIDMSNMFSYSSNFNQPIGNWDVKKVKDMSEMLSYATSFNQNLGQWNLGSINLVNNFYNYNSLQRAFDHSAIDCQNYAKTVQGWSQNPATPNNLNLGISNVKYGYLGKTYNDVLTSRGWKIIGGLFEENCDPLASTTENSLNNISIYPNPFTNQFKIKLQNKTSSNIDLQIFSSTGDLIYSNVYNSSKEIQLSPDKNLTVGVYTVVLSFDNISKSYRLIKN